MINGNGHATITKTDRQASAELAGLYAFVSAAGDAIDNAFSRQMSEVHAGYFGLLAIGTRGLRPLENGQNESGLTAFVELGNCPREDPSVCWRVLYWMPYRVDRFGRVVARVEQSKL